MNYLCKYSQNKRAKKVIINNISNCNKISKNFKKKTGIVEFLLEKLCFVEETISEKQIIFVEYRANEQIKIRCFCFFAQMV